MVEEEFMNEFLRKTGYQVYKCKKCGEKFWSLVPRDTCPDRPCSKYDFLYNEYRRVPALTFDEARRKFIEFFTSHGHEYVEPYPVLARWRNDLYLTIASIIVFQPAVTEGIIDPPYNPLVIVQPSVRLEDIDNVGLTFGRHLTSFEMGGHHAFNKKNQYVYWVNETLQYAFDFFTKTLGIEPENLVFKESWWEGGGNAGPAYEVLVDGLELATLVFMKYKIVNGEKVKNPVLVVDTGYGIERIAWFTQRTPTAFHTIFGSLLETYKNILGIDEPPYDVLKKIVYLLSDKEIEDIYMLNNYLEEINYSEYYKSLVDAINLYTALDHVKTLSLMLSDGIVPSNSGEGYLARLVIRRLLRTLIRLGIKVSALEDVVLELIDKQAKYWKGKYVYDKFHRRLDYILDVMSYETRKYVDIITRGIREIDRFIKKKKKLVLNDLIQIYDSKGIPPEIVAERAKYYGQQIRVPSNFYSLIAARHGGSQALVKEKEHELPDEIVEWASKHNPTKRLFHENPYLRRASAKILDSLNEYVIFDQTIFYPRAGGQDHDKGYIILGDEHIPVKHVYKVGEVIVHQLATRRKIEPGTRVELVIDWYNRYRLMRHHTATHIVLGAARKVLGEHVWQAGAEKTTEKARLDITHYKSLSNEEIRKIEELANKVIDEKIDLRFYFLPKFEAEKKFGLKIYQGGAVYSPILRIVEIPGWDAEACFGTHVYNTSEVGGIKIIKSEKIQDGVIRLEYIASTRLPEYISDLQKEVDKALEFLGVKGSSISIAAKKVSEELDKYKVLLIQYRKLFKEKLLNQLLGEAQEICGLKTVVLEKQLEDEQLYKSIIEELSLRKRVLTIYVSDKFVEIAIHPDEARNRKLDLRSLVKILKNIGGKGGGKPDHIYIKIKEPKQVIKLIVETIANLLCKA
ncbi:alanine--tRNA ligase [Staphylothermus hellenicus]|uniref:Alanine--tRNA ligase n=1 Tax=Staphylothermus hellenicus (strain DSM 12710 / JCM 10830 / BK20S6-10-b1 / P8) TaxID=591019 RepID=D7D9M2_STAHD|nr:alanine--tRNA ligase [Staphylothermus hellenicus]ADI32468.1 alanyl-tRNA synthetase [Staphylothermus hellenicus DSM 12710]